MIKLLLAGAALAAPTASAALADTHHPDVPPQEDLLARAAGLPAADPRPYEDCVGQSCRITFGMLTGLTACLPESALG